MDLSIGEKKKESRRNPARIPPQTPPAGGKSAEARRIHSPRKIVSPCLVRICIFNHLDFARKTFELCPTNTATASQSLGNPERKNTPCISDLTGVKFLLKKGKGIFLLGFCSLSIRAGSGTIIFVYKKYKHLKN